MDDINSSKTQESISEQLEAEIVDLAKQHGLNMVVLFGSRARGDHHRTSDIDLAISGGDTVHFALDVDELTHTLLQFDCVNLDKSVHPELRSSIDCEGRVLYAKA